MRSSIYNIHFFLSSSETVYTHGLSNSSFFYICAILQCMFDTQQVYCCIFLIQKSGEDIFLWVDKITSMSCILLIYGYFILLGRRNVEV